ncbi:MAG: rhomboid family intramembrane serine protease [Candidatus Desulfofervidaceae bacterium]|nr:rhomboid family intramembrane serine protease [Candidatus Desulfofervidaceae bacterium]
MFPLKDNIPSRRFPCVTVTLIAVNVLVFFHELSLGPYLERFVFVYGVVPKRYFLLSFLGLNSFSAKYLPLFTSMFLHGGWLHLIGNMWYLWIFGDNVEDSMGRLRFFVFYLLCGIGASLVHVYTHPYSTLPTIGASGAISGVMGAYFVLFPFARIITLVPIFLFLTMVEIPALFFLLFWFMFQFFHGTFSILTPSSFYGGVAWWAHIGGFICGIILVFFFKKRQRRRFYPDEYRPW